MSVSNNSLFTGPLFTPTGTLVQASNPPSGGGVTTGIDGGTNVGNVFQGKGGDFLDPDSIQHTLDKFGGSIHGGGGVFGNNPNALKILGGTNANISRILNSGFPSFGNIPLVIKFYVYFWIPIFFNIKHTDQRNAEFLENIVTNF